MKSVVPVVALIAVWSPSLGAADDFGAAWGSPHSFRAEVEAALEQLRRILDEERHPQYPADVAHVYEDGRRLSELATKAASAGLVQLFRTLLDNTWPGFSGQTLPEWATGAPLLVFSSCQFCELKETVDKEIQVGSAKIEEKEGILGSWKSKVKTKAEVQEHFWNWTATWRLYMTTAGSDQSFPLLSGSGGTTLKTMTTPPAKPQQPRPTAECAPTLELDMTWLARRLRAGAVDFTVNRTAPDCRTPARNKDTQAALSFFNKVHVLGDSAANILMGQLGTLLGGDKPGAAKPGWAPPKSLQLDVSPAQPLAEGEVFHPVLFQPVFAMFALDGSTNASCMKKYPLIDHESDLKMKEDMDVVLSAHRRSLQAHRESQEEHLRRISSGSGNSVDRSLISLLIVVQEMASLARQITSAVRELERMLQEQLTAAIGKTLQPADFGEYMEFHSGELLRPAYKPNPFVFAVRRAQHHPEGTVSIEAYHQKSRQAISTFSLHREAAPFMRMQLSSAATISFTGEHFVHAAVLHQFARQKEKELRLVARARQLSCFVLVVGKIISSDAWRHYVEAPLSMSSPSACVLIACTFLQCGWGNANDGAYVRGRLNLPFVGHTTFGKFQPGDLNGPWLRSTGAEGSARPDFAVLGVPNDMGTQYRSGARMGPRAIREASTLYQFGHAEVYDADTGETYQYGDVVDIGDVDIVHTDQHLSLNRTRDAVELILQAGVTPFILGGDHATTAPVCSALSSLSKPVFLVQIDAHLDFVDERHGVRYGHGNCMRRCLEMPHINAMLQLGIRSVSSTAKSSFEDARRMGSTILSVRKVRELGVKHVAELVPSGALVYFSVDIDGFDPSIAPGTGTPSHGGFSYYEVKDLLREIILFRASDVAGLDLVEVAPPYDPAQVTSLLAARVVFDAMGFIKLKRQRSTNTDTFKPAAALIIQNKDELVIPLLLETVPSPKEFLDSIQSLSPEQQRFAKAFRKMQLSSSLFAVAIVQIKPALEPRLRSICYCDYMLSHVAVAPDLMSYEPWSSGVAEKAARVTAADKLAAVKSHVKSLWETIAASKQKQLQEKQEEVKLRNMQSCGAEDCSARFNVDELGVPSTNYKDYQELHELGGHDPPKTAQTLTPSGSSGRMAKKAQSPKVHSARMKAADAPSSEQPPVQDAPSPSPPPQAREAAEAADSGAFDYTQLPHRLDANYLKFDSDAVLRPTKIDLAAVWTKQEQPGLLGDARSRQLHEADQRAETNKAFDLLDALSRSGAEALESSLHIMVAATHCFDETILNTLVQQNRNPIEKTERSMLIMASTLHRTPLDQLLNPGEVDRVRALMPTVFAGLAESKKLVFLGSLFPVHPGDYSTARRAALRHLGLEELHLVFEASVLQVAIMGLIIISTILAVFETVPSLYKEHIDMFKLSEKVFTAIFTAEVLLRAASTESCRNYICAVSNQIDILATSPWYLEKILVATMPTGHHNEHLNNIAGSLRTLRMVRLARMVRLVRVLRIAKFARHSEVLSVVVESLVESISGIWVLVAFVSMWALISATVVYAVESEQPDTDFDSIPAAMWWSMATISTVGYGDMVPETAAGKVVGGASMLGGILITSIAVAVITTTFTEHYQDKCRMREAMKLDRIQGREDEEGPGPNGTPPPQSSRRDADNPIVAWDLMEKDVLKHIIRLEAELLDRPLRERNTSNTMAIQMLEEQAKNFFKQGKSLTQQVMMEKVSRITEGELAEEPPGERGESKASIISSV
ncbi:AGMAT [Symbiodinium sp. CCMP2592]|nr:AGMAT [Symbiodinium sp. CCMP2592]